MSTILTVSGPAGGTGKTTVAVNLSAALALYEKKVLVMDCDPRASATSWIQDKAASTGLTLSSILRNTAIPEEVIIHTDLPFLDLVPAGFDLFNIAQSLSSDVSGQALLKQVVQHHFSPEYDYIIIDAPSGFEFLSMLAMAAGDCLLVPVGPDRTSSADCRCLLKLVHYIRKTHQTRLRIAGFVFNECGSSQDIPATLEKKNLSHLSDLVFDTFIPQDVTVARAMDHQVPVLLEDINSPAGQAFLQFAREIDSIFT
jgi:chromosome partitioning protein